MHFDIIIVGNCVQITTLQLVWLLKIHYMHVYHRVSLMIAHHGYSLSFITCPSFYLHKDRQFTAINWNESETIPAFKSIQLENGEYRKWSSARWSKRKASDTWTEHLIWLGNGFYLYRYKYKTLSFAIIIIIIIITASIIVSISRERKTTDESIMWKSHVVSPIWQVHAPTHLQ